MINNLLSIIYMLSMLAIVICVNTILGSVIANKRKKFKWSTFWKGIIKSLIIAICMVLFCITLELVPAILKQIGIDVPSDVITLLEVVLMTLTAYKKYASDCIDKFKTILDIRESE